MEDGMLAKLCVLLAVLVGGTALSPLRPLQERFAVR